MPRRRGAPAGVAFRRHVSRASFSGLSAIHTRLVESGCRRPSFAPPVPPIAVPRPYPPRLACATLPPDYRRTGTLCLAWVLSGTNPALSRDRRTTNSPDPQDGRAVFLGPDFKRAESAESAGTVRVETGPSRYTTTSGSGGKRRAGAKTGRGAESYAGEREAGVDSQASRMARSRKARRSIQLMRSGAEI